MKPRFPVVLSIVAAVAFAIALGFSVELVRSRFVQGALAANYITVLTASVLAALVIGVLAACAQRAVGVLLVAAAIGAGLGYWRFSTHPWAAVIGFSAALGTALLPLHAALVHGTGISKRARGALIATQVGLVLLGAAVLCTAPAGAIDPWVVAADSSRHVTH